MKIEQRLSLLFAAYAAFALPTAWAQTKPAQSESAQSKPAQTAPAAAATPISLPVTVVNDKGDPVKNLAASSLTLIDSGQPQKVDSFGLSQPTPMTIGLLVQTSGDVRAELGDARLASVHFVDHTIPGSDNKFFVIQFADEVDLLENPTSNINKLHDAINQLGSPNLGNTSGDQTNENSHDQHQATFGANLNDAIYLACVEVLKKQPGRHVLIVITDGVDRGSKESFNEAVEAAQSTNTMVYSIYYRGQIQRTVPGEPGSTRPNNNPGPRFPGGVGFPGGGGSTPSGGGRRGGQQTQQSPESGERLLEQLGNATGGYKAVGRHDKAEEAYNQLGNLLKNVYTLTWTPDSSTASAKTHHITLTTKEKGVYPIVQGYYTAQH